MSGGEPERQKRRANVLEGADPSDVSRSATTNLTGAPGVFRIPRHAKKDEKSNSPDAQSLRPSGLFGDLAATSGGSNNSSFGALLGAAQGASIFNMKKPEPESDDDAEHTFKRSRRRTEFDFEAARVQLEEDARKKAEAQEDEQTPLREAEKEATVSRPKQTSAAPANSLTAAETAQTSDAPPEPQSNLKSLFGGGLFGFGASTGQSLFSQAPTIKPLESSGSVQPEVTASLAEDISVDTKSSRPASFPGETDEDVLLEDFDSSMSVVVKSETGQWALKKIGPGVIRVLKDKSDGSVRCVFRLQGLWRLELNAPVSTFTMMESPKPQVAKFMAFDLRKTSEPPEKQRSVFVISFPSGDRKNAFTNLINQ